MLVHASLIDASDHLDSPVYRTIEHDGATRSFTLHVPADVKPSGPLVMVMPGYMASAGEIMDYSGFNAIADREGFIVAYPEGTRDQFGYRFFNVGYDHHATSTVDDLGYRRRAPFCQPRRSRASALRGE